MMAYGRNFRYMKLTRCCLGNSVKFLSVSYVAIRPVKKVTRIAQKVPFMMALLIEMPAAIC
jgi:hypothetical protein